MKKLLAVIAAVGMMNIGVLTAFAENSDDGYEVMPVNGDIIVDGDDYVDDGSGILPISLDDDFDQSSVTPDETEENGNVSILESEDEVQPEPDAGSETDETELPTVENPETGVTLGIAAAIICGVLVIGCVIFSIISKKKKGGKGKKPNNSAKKK